jgi:ABC-type branched-subunit amino acid transport system substrate-binding protein
MDSWTKHHLTRRNFLKLTGAALAAGAGLGQGAFAQSTRSTGADIRIGAVFPIPTGNPAITDTVTAAAQVMAKTAGGTLSGGPQGTGPTLKVLLASSPTAEAAARAADRLVTTEGVCGFIGGLGEGQAEALSKVASERNVLFFNTGSPADALRGEACNRTMFHVEASATMYLEALASYFASLGKQKWFIVYADSDEGKALYQRAKTVMGNKGEDVGNAEIATGPHAYNDVFAQIRKVKPDAVLLLLDPADQDFFLGQYQSFKLAFPITGFPFQVAQARDFYGRFLQSAPKAGAGYRAALWDATLMDNGAAPLNLRYLGQTGKPMAPSGWAAYAGVKILYEAAAKAGTESGALISYLESSQASFDVLKGVDVSFRSYNHQLRQPLYMVKLNPKAKLDTNPQDRLDLASVAAEVPKLSGAESATQLDALGISKSDSQCRFSNPSAVTKER